MQSIADTQTVLLSDTRMYSKYNSKEVDGYILSSASLVECAACLKNSYSKNTSNSACECCRPGYESTMGKDGCRQCDVSEYSTGGIANGACDVCRSCTSTDTCKLLFQLRNGASCHYLTAPSASQVGTVCFYLCTHVYGVMRHDSYETCQLANVNCVNMA